MKLHSDEEWRPVVGWEGLYEVSSHGRVRSLDREFIRNGHPVRLKGVELSPAVSLKSTGHLSVGLYRAGKRTGALVHRLVLRSFKGDPPSGKPYALHGDGNPRNNRVGNLRWGSQLDNMGDAKLHGTIRNQNSGATHCKKGHPFIPGNTYWSTTGSRTCKVCHDEHSKKGWAERRARGLGVEDSRHGTYTGYTNWGCKCDPCKQSFLDYHRAYKKRKEEMT